jgi:hypothetical protein
MKISKTHEKFASYIKNQGVLDSPQFYIGPNWEEVINFWLYLDTLSEEQMKVVEKRYWDLSYEERKIARGRSRNVARDTTRYSYDAYCSVSYTCNWKSIAACASLELIGLDKLLEQGHQPVFFPMFLNPF